MMKRFQIVVFLMMIVSSASIFSQSIVIEKLGEIRHTDPSYSRRVSDTGMGYSPVTISVNEVSGVLGIEEFVTGVFYSFLLEKNNLSLLKSYSNDPTYASIVISLGDNIIGFSDQFILLQKGNKEIVRIGSKLSSGGISFILKNDKKYIVFFNKPDGYFGAVDTNGKMYTYREVLALLSAYDPIKFEQSKIRAREMGLEERLLTGKALVWGKTFYGPVEKLEEYWNIALYPSNSGLIQYDLQGNGYQDSLHSKSGEIWIVNPNAENLEKIDVTKFSKILDTYERGRIFTTSTYVGFGGNIYFYVAGEDFTEVFRIRRTWGDPDMYAMAINGYTKDAYGQYVDTVLEKMSKDDLRLLRNHVFALYGYVFKDAALNGYFDKLVWYLAKPEVNLAGLTLPEERKALADRVLEEEKKR